MNANMIQLYVDGSSPGFDTEHSRFKAIGKRQLGNIPQLQKLPKQKLLAMRALMEVFPFRANPYVLDELIDWSKIPEDPMFQLVFPQEGMLDAKNLSELMSLIQTDSPKLKQRVRDIQWSMNPHPSAQMELNVPKDDDIPVPGIQHKYRETALFFPSQGQTCHAYCSYCFRWAQFVGIDELKLACRQAQTLVSYLESHPELTDVLFTGGDPLIMKTSVLERYLEALWTSDLANLKTIRLGTKSISYWPQRFTTDADADDLLRLFEKTVKKGYHLAIMAHFSHDRELEPPIAQEAVRRILSTGAVIRCQAPIMKRINDDPRVWGRMWKKQVSLGMVPYYMFIARDTGPKNYFQIPLAKALNVYQEAFCSVSGLARTARGPSMSASPGKILVDGTTLINGRKAFVLKFLQGRVPEWTRQVFFAEYDEKSTWIDELTPFEADEFFYEPTMNEMMQQAVTPKLETLVG